MAVKIFHIGKQTGEVLILTIIMMQAFMNLCSIHQISLWDIWAEDGSPLVNGTIGFLGSPSNIGDIPIPNRISRFTNQKSFQMLLAGSETRVSLPKPM